jgi:hypothetical protein
MYVCILHVITVYKDRYLHIPIFIYPTYIHIHTNMYMYIHICTHTCICLQVKPAGMVKREGDGGEYYQIYLLYLCMKIA